MRARANTNLLTLTLPMDQHPVKVTRLEVDTKDQCARTYNPDPARLELAVEICETVKAPSEYNILDDGYLD